MTYIAAFPPEMSVEAHSYFRYNPHLSLVLVLSLALAARDFGAAAWLLRHDRLRLASAAVLVLAAFAPGAVAERLRVLLDTAQPIVFGVGLENFLPFHDGARLGPPL